MTTVATPSKWPGRWAPQSPSLTPATETVVAKPGGIDLVGVGGIDEVDPERRELLRVGGLGAGIGGEIGGAVELARVDEEGDDHPVRPRPGRLDEREVAGVQRPHGRDHADPGPLPPPLRPGCAQVGQGAQDREAHPAPSGSGKVCSGAGKRRARTSAA